MSELSICEKLEKVDVPKEGMALVFTLEKSMDTVSQFQVKSYNNFANDVSGLTLSNRMLWFVIQGILAMTSKEPNKLMYRGMDEFRKFFKAAGLDAEKTDILLGDIRDAEPQGNG